MSTPIPGHHAPFDYSNARIKTPTGFSLLELLPPGAVEAELLGRIFVDITIERLSRPFRALSYCWGDGPKSHSILIVGAAGENEKQTTLAITATLETALRHLRQKNEAVWIWIDQVCINQDDTVEKGQQVALMGSIYSRAEQVLVWLGPSGNDSDSLMEVWQRVGQAARDFGMEDYYTLEKWPLLFRIMNNVDPADPKTAEYQALLKTAAADFVPLIAREVLRHWFARPWFTRAWIVQELCLCPDTVFVCGTQTVAVDLVMLAIQILQSSIAQLGKSVYLDKVPFPLLSDITDEPTARLFSCRQRRRKFDRGEPNATGDPLHALLRKLYVQHSTNATLPRDRIFSLLGLAVDAPNLSITPDYCHPFDPATEARILTAAARAMITGPTIPSATSPSGLPRRVDHILCFSQFPKTPDLAPHLPSWVPDWRANLQPSFYEINEVVSEHLFAACGSQIQIVPATRPLGLPPYLEADRVLGLAGYLVDEIREVAEGEAWDNMSPDAARFVGYFEQVDGLVEKAMARNDTPPPALCSETRWKEGRWRVPIGDLYWTPKGDIERAPAEVEFYHRQCVEGMRFLVECTLLSDQEQEIRFEEWRWKEKRENGELGADYRESMKYMIGERPFLTRLGYLGMGPTQAVAGDVVVVFCGGRIPFVLRPVESKWATTEKSRKGLFEFVGEAYCDGIMDGEILGCSREIEEFFLV